MREAQLWKLLSVVSITVYIGDLRLGNCYENELLCIKIIRYRYGDSFNYIFL